MRIRIQLILDIRQPESTVRVKYFLAQRSEKLLEHASAIDTRPAMP
jgi:hypothetical protein